MLVIIDEYEPTCWHKIGVAGTIGQRAAVSLAYAVFSVVYTVGDSGEPPKEKDLSKLSGDYGPASSSGETAEPALSEE